MVPEPSRIQPAVGASDPFSPIVSVSVLCMPQSSWHRWFAWYPVPTAVDGKLHYAWLQRVERKWGTGIYSGTIKWRYRLPRRSRSQ
jgi:hypothetical protein